MIHGRLCRLGYSGLRREDFESFTKFRDARESADQLVAAILEAITKLEGKSTTFPPQGEVPEDPARLLGTPFLWLRLKRLAAWMDENEIPPPLGSGEDLSADPKLGPFLLRRRKPNCFPHLVLLAESGGCLVPLDFSEPLWLLDQALSVASLPRLLQEIGELEERLKATPEKFPEEQELLATITSIAKKALERNLSVQLETREDE